ncbi:MAG: ATP-binding protein [Haliea sp.]
MVKRKPKLPLFVITLLPSLVGVILISAISWRLFDPAVERSSEVALQMMEDMIRTTGSESLRYPLAIGDDEGVQRLAAAMASNQLVFAIQVADSDGRLIAREQNRNLPIGEGIQILEYREDLYIEAMDVDEVHGDDSTREIYVGQVLYQLSPHILAMEKERLITEYRVLVGAFVALGLVLIFGATRILWRSVGTIKHGLGKIADGESGVIVEDDSFVTEFSLISRGVNQLSDKMDLARAKQEKAMRDLEIAAARAQQSDRDTRSFYEMATREIAEPVMRVVELLKLKNEADATPVSLSVVLDNAERVKLSVLAMLGKLNDDRDTLADIEGDLVEYFGRLEKRFSPRFEVRKLAFVVDAKGDPCRSTYKFDIRTLDIVLEKLLDNALQYTPEGEIRVNWQIEEGDGRQQLLVSVRDNGIGIAEDDQERVFERYTRVESQDVGGTGSGLGLYIARELLKRQGGTLTVRSRRGVGSEFTVTLPVVPGTEQVVEQVDLSGKTALLVGTNKRDTRVIEGLLTSWNMVCLGADTAIEALALHAEHTIDVVIIDECVDDIDVDNFVTELKKWRPDVLVGLLTDEADHPVSGYSTLAKPVDQKGLFNFLRKVTVARVAGVDYGLLDKLGARPDPNRD